MVIEVPGNYLFNPLLFQKILIGKSILKFGNERFGGYLAGRLRTRWLSVHTDEIYFRDTVHGFLAWSLAALITATALTSITGSIINGSLQAGSSVAGGAGVVAAKMAKPEADNEPLNYFVDALFRKSSNANSTITLGGPIDMQDLGFRHSETLEVSRIFMNSLHKGALPAEDIRYVGQMVAQRTNLSQQEAENRVTEIYSKVQTKLHDAETVAKDSADKARKAFAYATLWMFIALLIGAFVASLAATIGGRQRDLRSKNHPINPGDNHALDTVIFSRHTYPYHHFNRFVCALNCGIFAQSS